jgi:DNA polymerase-3 subunit beta
VLLEAKEDKLFLTTTNLDISICSSVKCEVIEEGVSTLPVKILVNSISKLIDGVIEVDINDNDLATISSGYTVYRIAGMSSDDFPQLPEMDGSFEYVIPQITFREMLRKTWYAASQDESRKSLIGVLTSFKDSKLTMVATDGRRLALINHDLDFPIEAERDVILPPKVVSELQRILSNDGNVNIRIGASQISFNLGDTYFYSKLIDHVYPDYRKVIPEENPECIEVDRHMLLSALERVSVMVKENLVPVSLKFTSNQLLISSGQSSVGEARDVVPIKYDCSGIEISFDPRFVMDPLKAIDEDVIIICMSNGKSPAVIKCSIPFIYVIMPLR